MKYFLVGIKGTGLSHLAAYLSKGGNEVEGCDVSEDFFTSEILKGITVYPLDAPLPHGVDLIVYSTSYENRAVPAMEEGIKTGVKALSYPQMLAVLSSSMPALAVCGTHGKSTTCAAASFLASSLSLPFGSVYGSFLLGEKKVFHDGDEGLIIEACEYQDHFMLYDPAVLTVTSIEFDHPDYFEDLDAVKRSFRNRVTSLKKGAVVVYNTDISRYVKDWQSERPDLVFIGYGDRGPFSLSKNADDNWTLTGVEGSFICHEKNAAIVYDYIAAAVSLSALMLYRDNRTVSASSVAAFLPQMLSSIRDFPGLAARGEVVKTEDGITYIDDYAHHPHEIKVCLDNLRRKYPGRRIIALFMPHTASRTRALMKDFVTVLSAFDALFIQNVYSSARSDGGNEASLQLYKALEKKVFRTFYGRLNSVAYCDSDDEAVMRTASFLIPGDVLVTLGAGDNRALIDRIASAGRIS